MKERSLPESAVCYVSVQRLVVGELNEIEAKKQTWRICGFDDNIYFTLFMVVLHLH